jgi:hypothetical protein
MRTETHEMPRRGTTTSIGSSSGCRTSAAQKAFDTECLRRETLLKQREDEIAKGDAQSKADAEAAARAKADMIARVEKIKAIAHPFG